MIYPGTQKKEELLDFINFVSASPMASASDGVAYSGNHVTIYVNQSKMPRAFHIYSAACPLFLSKTGKKSIMLLVCIFSKFSRVPVYLLSNASKLFCVHMRKHTHAPSHIHIGK